MTDTNNDMSNSSSPPTTTSSSPMNDSTHTSNDTSNKTMDGNRNSLNAPKYGTPVPNRVFVGGIPTDAKEFEVKNLFSQFGNVVSVKIITDRAGIPRGYGFVTYETEDDAKRVLKESDNLLIKNRKLNISVAIKKQQHFNDYRSAHNTVIYNPIMNTTSNTVYPDFGIYSSEGIPLYNLGVSPHLIANGAVTSAQNSYPYQTYQTPSGLYLTTNPASLAASQLIPQFQTSTGAAGPHGSATYPLLATPYRLPLAQNVNQMNSYIHMSNATTPPLSQTSSVPIQVHTSVANSMMGSDGSHAANNAAMNAINNGMSSLNFLQSPVYAISPNMPNSGQSMACVQNVQLKTDNRPDMSAENGSMMSPNPTHILELMPMWTQNVPNMQSSQQKMAPNRYIQYSSTAKPHPNQNTPQNTSAPAKDRSDRRNNSSSNNSHHYRKSANSSVGYHRLSNKAGNGGAGGGHTGYGSAQNSYQNHTNYANNSYENECQMVHNNSLPNALQGLPFVKHNNRLHTVPFNHQPMLNVVQQHHHSLANGTGGGIGGSNTGGVGGGGQPPMIPKLVNGVPIYTFAANSAGGGGGYGSPLTPPLTPGTHQMVHK